MFGRGLLTHSPRCLIAILIEPNVEPAGECHANQNDNRDLVNPHPLGPGHEGKHECGNNIVALVDNDVLPASTYGMRTCWLRRGPWGQLQDLPDDVEADLVLEGLGELPLLLQEWRDHG